MPYQNETIPKPDESPSERAAQPHAFAWQWVYGQVNLLSSIRRSDAIRRRLERARVYLEHNLEQDITLEELARHAHLSKFHFLRQFKAFYQETPLQYLRRRRLEQATRLLLRTQLPITDICMRVGFASLGSFTTLLGRSLGEAPRQYRRRYIVIPRAMVPPERLIPCCWLRRYGISIPSAK
jgi:AraC-like DNA-binding protein